MLVQGTKSQELSLEQCAEILESMTIQSTIDLGVSIIQCGDHPSLGALHVVSTAIGRSAVIFA